MLTRVQRKSSGDLLSSPQRSATGALEEPCETEEGEGKLLPSLARAKNTPLVFHLPRFPCSYDFFYDEISRGWFCNLTQRSLHAPSQWRWRTKRCEERTLRPFCCDHPGVSVSAGLAPAGCR